MPTLRELRKKSYLSQEKLARAARVPRESISRFETGKKKPGPKTIQALAIALRVEPQQIKFPHTGNLNPNSESRPVSTREQLELFRLVIDNAIRDLLPEVPDQDISRFFGNKKISDYIIKFRPTSSVPSPK